VSARRARETGCTLDEDARIAVIIVTSRKSSCRACGSVMSDKVFGFDNDLAQENDSIEFVVVVVVVSL
jgi:hypothetical protein